MIEKFKEKLSFLAPILPYGVTEPWDDLNPKLYHAVHIYWLKFYGMWYNNYSPKSFLFWLQGVYTLIVLWLVCFLPGIGEVVYLLRRRDNIGDVAEGLYLFLSEMYTYVKVAVFWYNKKNILELLNYLHCSEFKPKEREHEVIYRKSIKTARFVMTYYSTMCVGAVSVANIMPMTENFDILPTNVEYPRVDVYKTPAYQLLYLHHIYYKPATCIIDGVVDTILAAFIASASFLLIYRKPSRLSMRKVAYDDDNLQFRISKRWDEVLYFSGVASFDFGQIEILAFNLRNFDMIAERRRQRSFRASMDTELRTKDMELVLKDCIKHHNSIIRYVSMIENAFSVASALQFMLSVMVLCLVGIQFLSIENPTSHPMQIVWMAIYLTCMLIEVFILCWFGDELIWKSMDLRLAAFQGPWLKIDHKTCMYVIIFLERCNHPLRVTAGKIFTLSLDSYTVLINWSYKAFAVMRNMKK